MRRLMLVITVALLVTLGGVTSCGRRETTTIPAPPPPSALDLIGQRGEVRVCSTGDYRPFTYRDPTGQWTGIDIDMAKDLAAKLGARLTVVPTTWSNMVTDLTAGRCDLAMGGISVTLERPSGPPTPTRTWSTARPRSPGAQTSAGSRRWTRSTSRACGLWSTPAARTSRSTTTTSSGPRS
jgi:hypothetical protein